MGKERHGDTLALSSVSFVAHKAEVLVLLGPNGSGKTTLLRLVSAALLPDSGRILVNGCDTSTQSNLVHKVVAHVAAAERSFFPRLTAGENLNFFAAFGEVPQPTRKREIERVLAVTGLNDFRDTLAMKLSTGTYQKLAIARALLKQPSVLLLDEPTRSLDPAAAENFWPLVRDIAGSGTCLVVATHNFQEAVRIGDALVVLCDGMLLASRTIREATVEELRSFYLGLTGIHRTLEMDRTVGV